MAPWCPRGCTGFADSLVKKTKNVKSTLRYFDLYSPAIFLSLFSHTAVIISHLIALIAGLCSKRRAGVWDYKVTGLKLPLVYNPEVWQWPAFPNHSVCKHSRLQTKQIGVMPWTIWTIGTKLSTSSNTLLLNYYTCCSKILWNYTKHNIFWRINHWHVLNKGKITTN